MSLLSKYGNLDWLTEIKRGNVDGHRLIHKFGKNDAIGTTPTAVAIGGVYATPTANVDLEIVSDDGNDAAAGSGARKVMVQGLVLSGGVFVAQAEEATMNGTTAVALTKQFIRVFRAWISESGTYAGLAAVSSPGTITVRVASAGATWLQIGEMVAGNSVGQSQTAFYTTPTATKSILYSPLFTLENSKAITVWMFQRPNADDVTTPFTGARRVVHEWKALKNTIGNHPTELMPVAVFSGAVDIGFLAAVDTGTAAVSAEFWLVEIDN